MDEMQLLIDLHKSGYRQGPGSDAATRFALAMTGIDPSLPVTVADIGCGTGASTMVLAEALNANITAIDFLPEFLEVLKSRSDAAGLSEKIKCVSCSMDDLPFADGELDLIWAEGSIYNIGFEKGIKNWRRFLRSGGILVASEITWLTDDRPQEIQDHWKNEYPEIGMASEKISILERNGYSPVGYYVLPESCWIDEYYGPMMDRFDEFLERHIGSDLAENIVAAERREIDLYETYREHVGYGVYIASKL